MVSGILSSTMISHLTIPCLLASLVSAEPVPLKIAITRGLGPSRTSFRQLNEYRAEDQDNYKYEESDQNQTAIMDDASQTRSDDTTSMIEQVIKMAKDSLPAMMSTDVMFEKITIVTITAVTVYVALQIISAILQRTFGMEVPILTAWNQVMKEAASSIVNTASGLLGSSDNPRDERALNELTSMVHQAIDAFNREYEQ